MSMYVDAVNPRRRHRLLGGWQTPSVPEHEAGASGSSRLARSEAPMAPQWEAAPRIAEASTLEDPYGSVVASYTPPRDVLEPTHTETDRHTQRDTPGVEEGEAPSRVARSAAAAPVPVPELEPQPAAPPKPSVESRGKPKSEPASLRPPVEAAPRVTPSAPAKMTVPAMSDITVEGDKDDALHDGMFEACRARISDAVLEMQFKLLKDSKYALSYKDKDKSLAVRTFVQKRKAMGFPAKEAFELQTDAAYLSRSIWVASLLCHSLCASRCPSVALCASLCLSVLHLHARGQVRAEL